MSSMNKVRRPGRGETGQRFGKIMNCFGSREKLRAVNEMITSSQSLATKDYAVSMHSSRAVDTDPKPEGDNIAIAELSMRESNCLNYEEARALLGRFEYQKGNLEAAVSLFDGIDISAMTPKMKITLAKRGERCKRHSQSNAAPPMSIHAVSLLLEAIFLKAKSLHALGRFTEAAQSCKVILDIVESSLPEGLPENFGADCKLQETLNLAVELLPELWKLADSPREAIRSYRRALLHPWNLDAENTAKIQKEFAIFLLYSGEEASPPSLRSQRDGSFIPKNNIEEAILLLIILLRKIYLKEIHWDHSILDHLTFALSVCGDLRALAYQVEELLPGIIDRKERYQTLALCYYGNGEGLVALRLLRKLLRGRENPNSIPALMMASKICGENPDFAEEGVTYACKALENLEGGCDELKGTANYLLGISLSAHSKYCITDSERVRRQSEAFQALESACRVTKMKDPKIVYQFSLEAAEQRKLDFALRYARRLLKLEGGSNIKGWLLLARILSAQKRFMEAETIINAALDETGKWDQCELLRTKAKLQIAQGQLKSSIDTYTQLLAVLQVQSKSFGFGKKLPKDKGRYDRNLEMETWHDLAHVYINLSQWRDAEVCLSKSKAINPYSASRYHTAGLFYEAKGLDIEALKALQTALDIDPSHAPSLISTAMVLRRLGTKSHEAVRNFLMNAIKFDRMNHSAWHNLGLVYKAEGNESSLQEAIECFEAAAILEESTPIEPFR